MKIVYRPHLKRRIKEREFLKDYPRKIYLKSKLHFFDAETNHYIAVAKMQYARKLRNLAISYDIIGENIEIVTIHPVSDKELKRRIETGRWVKSEKS